MPSAQHYDFTCDFDPSHVSLGNLSPHLPPLWRLATTSYQDAHGNQIAHSFTCDPICTQRLLAFMVTLVKPGAAAAPVIAQLLTQRAP